jgi:PAS domain S-box-containing protein
MKQKEKRSKAPSPDTSPKHKQAEKTLNQSEERYRTILENMQEGYFEVDLTGNFTFCNDSLCRIHGYPREELMGMNNRQYTEKEVAKKVFQAFNEVHKTGKPLKEIDWQIIRKDGIKRDIEASVFLLKDLSGKPSGFRGIIRDITERKLAENALRESEANYKQLFDNSPAAIYQVDYKSGKFLKANDAFCKYVGCSQEEITSLSPYDILTEDSKKLFLERIGKIAQGIKVPEIVEFEAIDRKGKLWCFQLHVKNIYDAEGHVVAADVVAHDITERKTAEELLRQSEEKYRLLADHMKDQVWLMDLNLKITYISPSVEKVLGYNMEELKQLSIDKLLTATSLQPAIKLFSDELSKALPASKPSSTKHLVELEFRCKNGRTLWGECSFSFIRDKNGKPLSILGEARDITERKQAEDKLQQTLRSLEKAVGVTIQVLVTVLEARDPYTSGHQSRVTNLASAIATEMGLDQGEIEGIRMAGSIHDIGKLSIPAEILTKPTKLTDIEFSLIKVHSQTGYDMLKDVESPWSLALIVQQHHERIDGSGYPKNLKMEEILMEARILAVADVVEAMASHRPYRASLGIEKALEEIEKNKGILYDESVVNACLKLFREKNYELT